MNQPNSLVIREASAKDYPAIAALHAANWQQHYRGIYSDAYLDREAIPERLAAWQQRLGGPAANQQVLVAMQHDSMVGFACFFIDEDPLWGSYLDNLHVAAAAQGLGVGRRLLQACAACLVNSAKTAKLYLWVYEANTAARAVYRHLGARHVGTEKQLTKDGRQAIACRYAWDNVAPLAVLNTAQPPSEKDIASRKNGNN